MGAYNAGARARLADGVALRDASDYARGLLGDLGTPHLPGELIRNHRELRRLALVALDRAVLIEALTGTSWAAIAAEFGMPEDVIRERYESVVDRWALELPAGTLDSTIYRDQTVGLRHDADPEGTAAALDAWFQRHSEPWDEHDSPMTRAIAPE